MLYIVFTTGRCNLRCGYCGGSFPPNLVPWNVKYEIEDLESFLLGDEEPIICFYGGEPLLNTGFIRKVMNRISDCKFIIQTNGTLVKSLDADCWRRFDAVLLSIDGRREVTDYYRGKGVYDKVIEAARWLRKIGYKGDLIARMTVTEKSDIYLDVKHLIDTGLFDHVHWQLDVVWSERWRDFNWWWKNSYLPGLKRLVDLWVEKAEEGTLLGIVPFQGILSAILRGKPLDRPPCGAGGTSLSILTDGTILACPIAVDAGWARLGNIRENGRDDVTGKVKIGDPCLSCRYVDYCGGRCLYAHVERLWGEEGFKEICRLTISLIELLLKCKEKFQELIQNNVIKEESLFYPLYNNSTEIIP